MRNPVLDAILDELRLAGIKPTISSGGKHVQIWWTGPDGQPRICRSSITPSDQQAPHKARAEVRRMLRADGMLAEPERKPAGRELSRIEKLEHRIAKLERMLTDLKCKMSTTQESM